MGDVISAFIVHTGEGRNSYELRHEVWKAGFRGANNERDTSIVEEVGLTAWVIAPVGPEGLKSASPALREVRDKGLITWIGFNGDEIEEIPIVALDEVMSIQEAKTGLTFVRLMKKGGTYVFSDGIDIYQ